MTILASDPYFESKGNGPAVCTYTEGGKVANLSSGGRLYQWPDEIWRYIPVPSEVAIYTWGYGNRKNADALFEAARAVNGVIVDIRLKAWSQDRPEWCGSGPGSLCERFGSRYLHLPALGNRNYNEPDRGIEIANPAVGIPTVLEILASGKSPILLCGCGRLHGCHRAEASRMLASQGYETREITWVP